MYKDDPHMGQGRSPQLLESQGKGMGAIFIILLLTVIAVGLYYLFAGAGLLPKPPPINIIG